MRLWYLAIDGQPRGPVTEQSVRDFAAQGAPVAATLAWTPGMEAWVPLSAVVAWLGASAPVVVPVTAPAPAEAPPRRVTVRTRIAAGVFGVAVLMGALGIAARMEAETPSSAAARGAGAASAPVETASVPTPPSGPAESDRILHGLQDHFQEGWSTPVGIDVVARLHEAGHFRVQYTTVDEDKPVSGCVYVRYRGGALDHKTSWETLERC